MYVLSDLFKDNLLLRALGTFKIPILGFTNPKLLRLDDEEIAVRIPLNRRTKNHLNCMYFGALAVGADTAVGLLAHKQIQNSGKRISIIFKDFHADYHRRAEGDVHFICKEGGAIRELVNSVISSGGERRNQKFTAYAFVPSKDPKTPVATFGLTLSLKLNS